MMELLKSKWEKISFTEQSTVPESLERHDGPIE